MTDNSVFQKLMDCVNCPRIAAWVACVPGGYPPSEARYDLGDDSNKCMYDQGKSVNETKL